jgi:hypothetical protein
MTATKRHIEVDESTASVLESRAAERGLSISELLAEMMSLDEKPAVLASSELTELDRQWEAIKAGEPRVPQGEIVPWLQTWGTPAFGPRRKS